MLSITGMSFSSVPSSHRIRTSSTSVFLSPLRMFLESDNRMDANHSGNFSAIVYLSVTKQRINSKEKFWHDEDRIRSSKRSLVCPPLAAGELPFPSFVCPPLAAGELPSCRRIRVLVGGTGRFPPGTWSLCSPSIQINFCLDNIRSPEARRVPEVMLVQLSSIRSGAYPELRRSSLRLTSLPKVRTMAFLRPRPHGPSADH
jgi:hypothetical protein